MFRGSEDDVLERYYKAYRTLDSQNVDIQGILRITGDCPLLEVELCDSLVENFLTKGLDYSYLSPRFAEGLDCEVFKPNLLKEAYERSTLNSEREHVTQYFHNNKDKFKIDFLDNSVDDSGYRITVDESEDFEVVKKIIEHFSDSNEQMNFNNIKQFLDSNPDVLELNSSIIRNEGLLKSLENDKVEEEEM